MTTLIAKNSLLSMILTAMTVFTLSCGAGDKPNQDNRAPQGTKDGGGGSLVIDGNEYKLADLFFKQVGDRFQLNEEIVAYLKEMEANLIAYGFPKVEAFFKDQIYSDLVMYMFVSKVPADCQDPIIVLDGFEAKQFACTRGYVTYIEVEPYSKLSKEAKVSAIIHERLHAWASQPHEVISPFIKGLYYFQKLWPKRREIESLTETEYNSLKGMSLSAAQLALVESVLPVNRLGGGRASSEMDGIFVSLDSEVKDSKVLGNPRILGSKIFDSTVELEVITDSTLIHVLAQGPGIVVKNSKVYCRGRGYWNVSEDEACIPSDRPVELGRHVQIIDSEIRIRGGERWGAGVRDDAKVIRSEIKVSKFDAGTRVTIEDSKVWSSGENGVAIEMDAVVLHSEITTTSPSSERGRWIGLGVKSRLINSILSGAGGIGAGTEVIDSKIDGHMRCSNWIGDGFKIINSDLSGVRTNGPAQEIANCVAQRNVDCSYPDEGEKRIRLEIPRDCKPK